MITVAEAIAAGDAAADTADDAADEDDEDDVTVGMLFETRVGEEETAADAAVEGGSGEDRFVAEEYEEDKEDD